MRTQRRSGGSTQVGGHRVFVGGNSSRGTVRISNAAGTLEIEISSGGLRLKAAPGLPLFLGAPDQPVIVEGSVLTFYATETINIEAERRVVIDSGESIELWTDEGVQG